MKLLFAILILGLSSSAFASDLTGVVCTGIAKAQNGANTLAAVKFKMNTQSKYIESYTTVSDWVTLVNPVTSDKLVNGERIVLRAASSGGPAFSLVIQEPNSTISLATLDLVIPMDHIRSTQMVCLLK